MMLPIEITADISLHPEFANGIRVDKRVTLSGPKSQVCHPQNCSTFQKTRFCGGVDSPDIQIP